MKKVLFIVFILGLAFTNVLDRYDTLKAHEIYIVNEDGEVILDFKDIVELINEPKKEFIDYSLNIAQLKTEIVELNSYIAELKDMYNSNHDKTESLDLDFIGLERKVKTKLLLMESRIILLENDIDSLKKIKYDLSTNSLSDKQPSMIKLENPVLVDSQYVKIDKDYDSQVDIKEIISEVSVETEPSTSNEESIINNSKDQQNDIFDSNSFHIAPIPYEGQKIEDFLIYPQIAIDSGVEGVVHIDFYINKNGRVDFESIKIISGIQMLNQAAINAVSKSVWTPAYKNDIPIGVYVSMPISFVTRDSKFEPVIKQKQKKYLRKGFFKKQTDE